MESYGKYRSPCMVLAAMIEMMQEHMIAFSHSPELHTQRLAACLLCGRNKQVVLSESCIPWISHTVIQSKSPTSEPVGEINELVVQAEEDVSDKRRELRERPTLNLHKYKFSGRGD